MVMLLIWIWVSVSVQFLYVYVYYVIYIYISYITYLKNYTLYSLLFKFIIQIFFEKHVCAYILWGQGQGWWHMSCGGIACG